MQIKLVPLPWYAPETYAQVTALMHDKDRLFRTYAEWHRAAQSTEKQMSRNGARTVRVVLDTVQFPDWCRRHRPGLNIDAEARIQYASYVAVQQYRADQGGSRH